VLFLAGLMTVTVGVAATPPAAVMEPYRKPPKEEIWAVMSEWPFFCCCTDSDFE
jgi:hypothetical protein